MTLDDEDEVHVLRGFVPIFWSLVGVGLVLLYYSIGYAKKYSTTAAFLLTPFICFSLVFDNAIMATTGIDRRRASTQAMLAFHACVTPMLLLVCYEVAYVVHKHKAVNFCGIAFDSGHRTRGSSGATAGPSSGTRRRCGLSTCLRLLVWLTSCGLLVLNLVMAYHWTTNRTPEVSSFYDLQGDTWAHVVCTILPTLALVALALYVGIRLWNYGTNYSYRVHATCFNPWIYMLLGTVFLLIGYMMPSPLYALSSNAGEVLMMAAIVRMFREVHHDMQQGLQFGDFIDPEGAARRHDPPSLTIQSHGFGKSTSLGKMTVDVPRGYIAVSTPKASEGPGLVTNRLHSTDGERGNPSSSSDPFVAIVTREPLHS